MIFCKGRRGKSKSQVTLSIDTVMGVVTLHVWEGTGGNRRITHTFYPDEHFLRAMHVEVTQALARAEMQRQRLAKL